MANEHKARNDASFDIYWPDMRLLDMIEDASGAVCEAQDRVNEVMERIDEPDVRLAIACLELADRLLCGYAGIEGYTSELEAELMETLRERM